MAAPVDVAETFRVMVAPELRDWLRRHRTGTGYPLVGYHGFVSDVAVRYLRGWGWMATSRGAAAQAMLDGIHVAASDAAVEVWPVDPEPLDGYCRAVAAKYSA